MTIPSEFIPISQLPDTPDLEVTDGMYFIVSGAGVSYRAQARQLVLPADPLLTAVDFSSNLPGSRYLAAGAGVTLVDGGAGNALTIIASSSGSIIVMDQSVDAALNATETNWNPTGWDGGLAKSRLRVTPSASANLLNSLDSSGCVDGQTIAVYNDSTTQMLRIPHQAAGAAGNIFRTPGGATFSIVPYQCVLIQLNGANGWRIIS